MLTFLTKDELWHHYDAGVFDALGLDAGAFLAAQAAAVYERVRQFESSRILEITKDKPLIVGALEQTNDTACARLASVSAGDPAIRSVSGPDDLLSAFKCDTFDVVLSANVLNSLSADAAAALLGAALHLLRPGGMTLHALEFYLENVASPYWRDRFRLFRSFLEQDHVAPLGAVTEDLVFSCDLATCPDAALYRRKTISPKLDDMRRRSQTVVLLFAARKL